MTEHRFIRIGPFRVDLFRVCQYSPLEESKLEIVMQDAVKLVLTFKARPDRDMALEFIDKCATLYAEAGDK